MSFLSEVFWGNSIGTWLTALAVGLATAVFLRMVVPRIIRRARSFARSTNTYADDALVAAATATSGFFHWVAAGARGGSLRVRCG